MTGDNVQEAKRDQPTEAVHERPPGWGAVPDAESLLPESQELVTLANWQEWPTLERSFVHMREIMPSHVIPTSDYPIPLDYPAHAHGVGDIVVDAHHGKTVNDILDATHTDGFLVMHHGQVIEERYPRMSDDTNHLVMSMSKSLVSAVVATLVSEGVLDVEATLETYVPEVASSGYAGATVRDLLDMRSGITFSETYLDPESEVRVMERSMGWAPRGEDDPVGMYPFILTCSADRPHGGGFEYRSVETDMLGWVCERATGMRMADLIAERVWKPIGAERDAEVSVDPLGSAIHDGGVSATLRDLARFGRMLASHGYVGDRSVVPSWWIEDTLNPASGVREAFASSANEPFLPGGWYRNQFWCLPGDHGPIMMCMGIHGQMIFIEPSTHLVGVKLSTWPLPQDAGKLLPTIEAFKAIGRAVNAS
ncbi:MAG: serine hydrolase [Ornithinimicrobium sp.]